GVCKRRYGHAKNHRFLVDVERSLGECEALQFTFGIGDFAARKAGGKRGLEIGGDQVVVRFFAGVDVEARANLHDHGNLERASAGGRVERGIDFRLDDLATGGNLSQQCCVQNQGTDPKNACFDFHRVTWVPSCWEMTRLITARKSSPDFSCTKALRESFQPSLRLVERAEIQISRTAVFGDTTNLASAASSTMTT